MKKKTGKYVPGDFELVPKRSSAGIGLYTKSEIPKGACIIEYVGKMLSEKEEYTRNSLYLFDNGKGKVLDGKPKWNKAGYINHSCIPNAEPETRMGHIYIMATKKIRPGEEITYDYGDEYFDEHIKPKGCKCPKHAK